MFSCGIVILHVGHSRRELSILSYVQATKQSLMLGQVRHRCTCQAETAGISQIAQLYESVEGGVREDRGCGTRLSDEYLIQDALSYCRQLKDSRW